MRKGLRHTLLVFLLLLSTLMAAMAWVLWTPSGARAVLAALSRFSSLQIEAAEVSGRLAGRLQLQGVRVRWPEGRADAESFLLDWHPGALLGGRLAIQTLALKNVEAWVEPAGEKPATPPSLALPEIGAWGRLQAEIESLQVDGFILHQDAGEPATVNRLAARFAVQGGMLAISEVQVISPQGRLAGEMSLDFKGPALRAVLQVEPASAPEPFRTVDIHLDLHPGPAPREMTGPMRLSARTKDRERLRLVGAVDWSPDRLALTSFHLTDPAGKGEADGEAEIIAGQDWRFALHVRLTGLDLAEETGTRTLLSGELQAAGSLSDFQGKITLANRVTGWQGGSLDAPFRMTGRHIVLPSLKGEWLRGRLEGSLNAGWGEGWQLQAELHGQGLDPAVVSPEWAGRVNFTMRTAVRGQPQAPMVAEVKGRLLESTLRGRSLTGNIDASLRGEELKVAALTLHGDGFSLEARGNLRERIDFDADISRLAGLLPDARGSLTARGWTRWRDERLSGKLVASGRDLAVAGGQAASLSLTAEHRGKGAPIEIKADLSGVAFQDWRFDSAGLQVRGTVQSHTLQLTLAGPEMQMQAGARGGYDGKSWAGEITALKTGGQRLGPWTLTDPASLRVAANAFKLSPFRLQGEGKESLQAGVDLAFSPRRGRIDGEWQQLDLGRANPWLPEISLAGRSSGSARIEWLSGDRLEMQGRAQLAGRFSRGGQSLDIRSARADLAWGKDGMQAGWEADLGAAGALSGQLRSTEPARLAVPRRGNLQARWRGVDLALLSPWLPETEIAGHSSGTIDARWQEGGGVDLDARLDLAARLKRDQLTLNIQHAEAAVKWNKGGLRGNWTIGLAPEGSLAGEIRSTAPAGMALPEKGNLHVQWEKVDLALLRPWMPAGMLLEGSLAGSIEGEWLPGQRLRLAGSSEVRRGELQWQGESGVITAALQQAKVDWNWLGDDLQGDMVVTLENYGRAKGSFQVPLPARLPTAMEPSGAVRGRLTADLQEEGLLNAFLPGLVQESSGNLGLDLHLGGVWQSPDFGGEIRLTDAGAYLPTAGIRLEKVQLLAQLKGQEIRIDSLRAHSGSGDIEGTGSVQLREWQLTDYQLQVKGKEFRVINLPELQMAVSPDLTIEGSRRKLAVRGEVHIPQMLVTGKETHTPVQASGDVVIVDSQPKPEKELPLELDIRVRIVLGKHVLVKAQGADARLEGEVRLTMTGLQSEKITAKGEIKVVQGKYAAYGIALDITRGSILFAGGPVDRPTLDILAVKTIGDVKAGVKVTGTPRQPEVKLYSEPVMPDTEVLSYIVLGHPIGEGSGGSANSGLLMVAAGALLSKGESAVLQDQIKQRLGIDVLEVESGSGDVNSSRITIGKYLSPDLFISFGQSLFSNSQQARLRYNLTKRWQVESSVGAESAVDVYYQIKFK